MTRRLVVGLGNPGKEYAKTRHNFGARAVEAWARENPQEEVLLPQPGIFMNDFGTIVPKDREIIIVHDDIELPLGEIKFQAGGSAKGHKGVRSVQAALGTTDIPRLRLGVGRPLQDAAVDEFVLGKFTLEEENVVAWVVEEAIASLTDYLHQE